MHPLLQRTLMAYRPLYLNGLLLDGRYKLPKADSTDAAGTPRVRRRTLLSHIVFHPSDR